MKYRTTFQCPETGQTIISSYVFGKVTMQAVSDDDEDIMPETTAYVNRNKNKRFKTFDAANNYIIRVSEGQTLGFEEDE